MTEVPAQVSGWGDDCEITTDAYANGRKCGCRARLEAIAKRYRRWVVYPGHKPVDGRVLGVA